MKLPNNEKGVSEIIGAMFILLILVIYLGVMQAYELPKWNKELEKQGFDLVYKDFLDLRSDIEDSSIKNMPITSSMHTGIRYPERFMLRNPGQGAHGVINTYPLRINISYNSNGTDINENYTSLGFVYEMKGISDFPKIVYEHGMVIQDFGIWNNSDDVNHLATENGIFIPFLKGIDPLYSIDSETFNLLPVTQYLFTEGISTMNVTLETEYPGVWAAMPPVSIPAGSQYTVNNGEIRITNISGFNLRNLSLPITSSLSGDSIYSGMIRFTDTDTVINTVSNNMTNFVTNSITNNLTNTTITNITNNITNINTYNMDNSSCSFPGRYIWDTHQGCINLPTSASVQKFIIKDMKFSGSTVNRDIIFNITDALGSHFMINLDLNSNATGDPTNLWVQQISPACSPTPSLSNGEINLTSCYKNASITSPNVLKITFFEDKILFAKFLIY
jgi:hypothetical protein